MRRLARSFLGGAQAAAWARLEQSAAVAAAGSEAAAAAAGAAAAAPWRRRLASALNAQRRATMWTDARGYEHFDGRGPVAARSRLHLFVGAAALAGGAYYQRSLQEVPYTRRRHAIMFVSEATELAVGQQVWEQTLREAGAEGRLLPPHHPLTQLVARAGRRVAAAACAGEGGGYQAHMRNIKWEFAVVDSDQVNAFVAPGGKVVVFTGLLKVMRSEDELAAVLAHEAAHVLARHTAERLSQANVMGFATIVANWVLGIPLSPNLLVLAFFLPHSRASEAEADEIGLQLLARACYDPDANVRMLLRLAAVQERGPGGALARSKAAQLLLTHPLSEERAARVRALLPEAYQAYSAHCSALRGAWRDAGPLFA